MKPKYKVKRTKFAALHKNARGIEQTVEEYGIIANAAVIDNIEKVLKAAHTMKGMFKGKKFSWYLLWKNRRTFTEQLPVILESVKNVFDATLEVKQPENVTKNK